MALVNKEITSLTGGVSRQPYDSRNPAQVQEATNTIFDPAKGATKRPPSQYKGSVSNISKATVQHSHTYNRDAYERYNIFINQESGSNKIRVFRASDGLEFPVTQTGTYLDQQNGNDFEMMTLGDTTLVVNKEVPVQMENTVTDKNFLRACFALTRVPTNTTGGVANALWIEGHNQAEGLMWTTQIHGDDWTNPPSQFGAFAYAPWPSSGNPTSGTTQNQITEYLKRFCWFWNRDLPPHPNPAGTWTQYPQLAYRSRVLSNNRPGENTTGVIHWERNTNSRYHIEAVNLGSGDVLNQGINTRGGIEITDTYQTIPPGDDEYFSYSGVWYNATDHGSNYGLIWPHEIVGNALEGANAYTILDVNSYSVGDPVFNLSTYKPTQNAYSTAWYWHEPKGTSTFIIGEYSYTDNTKLHPNTPLQADMALSEIRLSAWNTVDGLPELLNGEPNPYRDEILRYSDTNSGTIFTSLAGPPVEMLPALCEDGFRTKMVGDSSVDAESYYLKFSAADEAWVETRGGGIVHAFDTSTMPHVLNRILDNTAPNGIRFEFGPGTSGATQWAERQAGDAGSAPEPSIVGKTISGFTYFKGRLALIAGGSVVLSEINRPFNLWPTSVMTYKDSDPMDLEIAVGEGNVVNLFAGTSTEAGLVLFDRFSQHLLRAENGQPFGPRTASIDTISRYPTARESIPQFIGDRMFWTTSSSTSSKLWEFQLSNAAGAAIDVSNHVDQYLPANLSNIVGSKNNDIVTGWSDGDPTTLYIYKFYFSESTRLQAAWSKWVFNGNLVHTYFIDDDFYICIDRNGVINIEMIDMSNPTEAVGFPVCLDSRVKVETTGGLLNSTYVSSQDKTIFSRVNPAYGNSTYDYDLTTKTIVAGENTPWPGRIFEGTVVGNQVLLSGNLIPNGNEVFYLGESYSQKIELSRFVLATERTQYREARTYSDGRTQLKTLAVQYSSAGPFTISHDVGGDVYEQSHTPELIDSGFGDLPIDTDGIFKTDIGGRNTETVTTFKNDSPIPTTITGLRYEVQYHARGSRGGRS